MLLLIKRFNLLSKFLQYFCFYSNKQNMTDIEESLDKYYEDSDEDDKKSQKSDESDASVKALKRKLEALKNNEMDPDEAEKRYQEDLKQARLLKQQKEQQKEEQKKQKSIKKQEEQAYENDFGSDEEQPKKINSKQKVEEVEEDYEDKFELESNSFSIRSKQSIRSLKVEDEDNNYYTLKQSKQESTQKPASNQKIPSQTKTPSVQFKDNLKKPSNAAAAAAPPPKTIQKSVAPRPQSAKQAPLNTVKQDSKKQLPSVNGVDSKQSKPIIKESKTPAPTKKQQVDQPKKASATPSQTKLTQHQLDLQKKKIENEESEKKLEKKPKLPNIQSKTLKVNNFMKDKNEDQKKSSDNKKQEDKPVERKPKDELDEDIFGETEKEEGDQALAQNQDEEEESEETKKLKEKQLRQQILKDQKEKRKNQLDNQLDNVKQILKNHEQKQKELQEKEDQLYIREAVEKIKQKKSKQNLTYENEESNWVDITRKDYQKNENEDRVQQQEKFRQQMLKNLKTEEENLKKKKTMEQIQSRVSTRNEIKEKNWDGNLASKKGTLNEISKIESEKNEIARENEFVSQMKKIERKKYLEQLEIEKMQKKKAQEFVKEGQDNLKKGNKALENIEKILKEKDEKKQKEKEKNYQYEEQQKEKQLNDQVEIKKLKVILKQLIEENKQIQAALAKQKEKQQKNQEQINSIKNKSGVVVLGDNKFTSFGLVPALNKKQELTDISTNDEESVSMLDKINDQEKRYLTQLTVIELIVQKITDQGLTLSDIFSLLDVNKDGILTIEEIEQNMSKLDLDLTEEEIQEILKIIDSNKDGVINEFEFVKNLEAQYQSQKEYNRVMGELKDIQNPIVLQERILDLEVRQRVVIKCIKKEEEKEIGKGPEYQKYLEKLKKQEEVFEKRQKFRKQGKDMTELTAKAGQLKLQQKKLEDEKEMLVIMQRERMEAIQENIGKLTEELMQMSEIVIKAKNIVDKERNDYQKLVIKQVAIDRLQEQVDDQRRQKEIEQQKQAQKFQNNIRQKAKNIQYQQQQKLSVQNVVGATILLQKIYRGWKSRVQAKKQKEKLMRACTFIQVYFKWYHKKKKTRNFVSKLNDLVRRRKILALKLLQTVFCHMQNKLAPKVALIALKQLLTREEYSFIDQRQAKIQQYINRQKQAKPVEDDVFGQEEQEKGVNSSSMQQHQQPAYEQKIKQGAKDVKELFRAQELPAIITIQRGIRKLQNVIGLNSKNKITFTMGDISPVCRICQVNQVQILCRSCEQCVFCKSCYEKYHKSYHRKNHRFYDINTANYTDFDTGYDKEKVYNVLKDYLDELQKLFSIDFNTGYIPLEQVITFYQQKIHIFSQNKNLFQQACKYAERYVEKDNVVLKSFQEQSFEQKYDPSKKYIDHNMFIRSFLQFNKASHD
ncbi:EF-hand protein (macronuclear) [Tetrahymena thermophila SB210]|uniref:EF-hand protein n=1 Tax=Tetrahymena thermophila (strain SB210) TaxID=312017 RepID=I7M370_TETTS|nr:EF-hand protein [Tetrahymena thermophila SB210]EAS02452.2 EF-hand protein [Tetrahymena thermophila SB210]|eukprot:XP_001022697.2 EF-hand protein [Tetrahymena thermophila SB210]